MAGNPKVMTDAEVMLDSMIRRHISRMNLVALIDRLEARAIEYENMPASQSHKGTDRDISVGARNCREQADSMRQLLATLREV